MGSGQRVPAINEPGMDKKNNHTKFHWNNMLQDFTYSLSNRLRVASYLSPKGENIFFPFNTFNLGTFGVERLHGDLNPLENLSVPFSFSFLSRSVFFLLSSTFSAREDTRVMLAEKKVEDEVKKERIELRTKEKEQGEDSTLKARECKVSLWCLSPDLRIYQYPRAYCVRGRNEKTIFLEFRNLNCIPYENTYSFVEPSTNVNLKKIYEIDGSEFGSFGNEKYTPTSFHPRRTSYFSFLIVERLIYRFRRKQFDEEFIEIRGFIVKLLIIQTSFIEFISLKGVAFECYKDFRLNNTTSCTQLD